MQGLAPPETLSMLQERVAALAGLSLSQCAARIGLSVPSSQKRQKGWIGNLMEKALGADAKCLPIPDFSKLGIELKTLPIGKNGKPTESTFVSSIALKNIQKETWPTSTVFRKLSHVLWIPIEDDVNLPLSHRRIGQGFLWRPSKSQESLLEKDWNELSDLIVFGDFESITARLGEALQIRPKAATGTSLTKAFDDSGTLIQTLPRGFYLRSRFTASLLK